jgi:hypothetical protein
MPSSREELVHIILEIVFMHDLASLVMHAGDRHIPLSASHNA